MRSKFALIALGCSALAACNTPHHADQGVAATNIPVVTTANYVFEASAPGGVLAPGSAERLDGWFQGLGIGYGDSVYVDGPWAPAAREQVAMVAGRYGMMVDQGAPVLAGMVAPDSVRVIVSRRRASVPGCPNWSRPAQPSVENRTMSNFACAVNSNLSAMVADPGDLIHGRDVIGPVDPRSATRPVQTYRNKPQSGEGGLQSMSTKGS